MSLSKFGKALVRLFDLPPDKNELTVKEYRQYMEKGKDKPSGKKGKENSNPYGHVIQETVTVGGKTFPSRSRWEANYARYLEFLKKQRKIKDWEYEPCYFEFPVVHGISRYKPDFLIHNVDGTCEYHEVKGRFDSKSKTKLNRMKKYHPLVKVVLIDSVEYYRLQKYYGKIVNGWVFSGRL